MSQKKVYICFAYCVNATNSRGAGGMSIVSLVLGNSAAMDSFSGADRALCVREFYKNGDSATVARIIARRFCNIRGYRHLNDPKHKHQKPLHSPKVTLWAAMSSRGIIGPYFFEDERGCAVTVNSERYVKMLDDFLVPELQNFSGYNQGTWFQQDGATSHTSNTSLSRVREIFPGKLISRRGDIN